MAAPEAATGSLLQPIGEGLSVVLIAIGLAWNYMRGKKSVEPESKPASHMVLEASSLADIRQITDRIDKMQASSDTQNLHLAAIDATQLAILKEMRDQAAAERERREEEDQEELRAFRSEERMRGLLKKISDRHDHDKPDRDRD